MQRLWLVAAALAVLALGPAALEAQAQGTSIGATPAALMESARLRPRAPELWRAPPAVALGRTAAAGYERQGEVLMIVGAAAIVTGVLADSDMLAIAGVAVGCVGFYLYLEGTR